MAAERSPKAHSIQEAHPRNSLSDDPGSDDDFPDILSEKFAELCRRHNQELLKKKEHEALKPLLDHTRAALALEAVEAVKITRPVKAAKPINTKRAETGSRRSPRLKAASRSNKQNGVQGFRRSARILSRALAKR